MSVGIDILCPPDTTPFLQKFFVMKVFSYMVSPASTPTFDSFMIFNHYTVNSLYSNIMNFNCTQFDVVIAKDLQDVLWQT